VADFAASSVAEYLILDGPVFRDKVRLAQVQYGAIANGDPEFNAANTWRDLKPIYRQCAFSSAPWWMPRTVLVFPASIVRR